MITKSVQCCVVGGGPAGMMAATLLARQGVKTVVLEKHSDFLRDFRGDTIHPSTLEVMHELGWADELLALPHREMSEVTVRMGGQEVTFAEFRTLKVHYPFIAFMPQWDFLNFLSGKASAMPSLKVLMNTEMTGLQYEDGRVVGIAAQRGAELMQIRADLVIAADGRHSTSRVDAKLVPVAKSAPLDVLWFRLARRPSDRIPFFQGGNGSLISVDRGDYWQLAYAIPTSSFDSLRQLGIPEFRSRIARLAPCLSDRVDDIKSWDDVHQLTVQVDRLTRWYAPGLLCIGDAAHAMSPAGGVGINLAIQDAVATSNILGPLLVRGLPTDSALRQVQRRRELPARVTQTWQTTILKNLYPKNLTDDVAGHVPVVFRAFQRLPFLRHLMGRFVGLGVRPEHIETDLGT